MDPTVRLIKLVSGESIIGITETNCEDLTAIDSITITDPVLVNSIRVPKGGLVYETFVMQPWIALSEDFEVDIATKHILITTSVKESVEAQYFNYLEREQTIDTPTLSDRDELEEALGLMADETDEEYYVGEENETPITYH